MEILQIRCLGGLRVSLGTNLLTGFHSSKAQALLCYLAVTGRQHSRSSLAGLLWRDVPEANARANLRKVLSNLRRLAESHLTIDRHEAGMNLEAPLWLDVKQFEEAAASGVATPELEAAISLYQGDFLHGFDVKGAPAFEQWSLSHRARLRQLAANSLDLLLVHAAMEQDFATAIQHAGHLLEIEPWREEAHRQLMRLLAQSGQRTAALRQYETCRRLLWEELSVEPSAATETLYEAIAKDELDQEMPAPSRQYLVIAAPQGSRPRHNIPAQATPFIGREEELREVVNLLSDPAVHLVTISGPGGIGKTRLALAAATTLLDSNESQPSFPHGVYFVSLAPMGSPDLLVPTLAEAFGFRFINSSDPKEQLLRFLRHKAMLLILDNFEHLLGAASLVDDMLSAAPDVTLLVTSRSKLNRRAEHLFPIKGFTYPPKDAAGDGNLPADVSSYGAIQLFGQCARRVRPDFSLTEANLPAVVDICRLVEGLPLGIVLATSWLDTLSPEEIVREIRRDLDFLSSDMGDVPPRQRSLRAAFNRSWHLLTKREQEIFQELSVFRGGFTRQAASAITGARVQDLRSLVSKSLLALTPDNRYEIHELLRQFAGERLANSPAREESVRDRHSDYYCALLHRHTEHWHSGRQLKTRDEVILEADNMQNSWDWAIKHCDWRRLREAIDCWIWHHDWHGRFVDGEALCQTVIQKLEEAQAEEGIVTADCLRLWAKALTWQGWFSVSLEVALHRLQQALALVQSDALKEHDTRFERAFVHLAIGENLYSVDRQRARQHLETSLRQFQELKSDWGTAKALSELGQLDFATGDYPAALARNQAALAMHQARGDQRAQMASMNSLAWVHQHLGHLDEALLLRHQVLELCRQLKARSPLALYLANLSSALFWQGKFEEERSWAEKSLAVCLEDGRRDLEGYVRLHFAFPLLLAGKYQQARQELNRALARVREANHYGEEATVHWALGCLALVEGAYEDAQEAMEKSRGLYDEVGDQYLGFALSGQGYVACLQGELSLARRHFIEALAHALTLRDYTFLILTLPGVALYLARVNQVQRALMVWARARVEPFVRNSRWHKDVIGREVEVTDLPRDLVAEATKRGLSQDLWAMADELSAEL